MGTFLIYGRGTDRAGSAARSGRFHQLGWGGAPRAAQGRFQPVATRDLTTPLLVPERPVFSHAPSERFQLGVGLGLVHLRDPIVRAHHRPFGEERWGCRFRPASQARPWPVLGSFHEVGAPRVALDVTKDGQQVVILDEEGTVSPLVHAPRRSVVMASIPPNVSREQPVHPSTHVLVTPRPQDKVKMVRHEAVGEHSHRNASTRLLDEIFERPVVAVLEVDAISMVATTGDVTTHSPHRCSCCTWHRRNLRDDRPNPFAEAVPRRACQIAA